MTSYKTVNAYEIYVGVMASITLSCMWTTNILV